MGRVQEVQKDIDVETSAIQALNLECEVFATELCQFRKKEIGEQLRYHTGRLMFFAFAMVAAKREDEDARLIELGRNCEAKHSTEKLLDDYALWVGHSIVQGEDAQDLAPLDYLVETRENTELPAREVAKEFLMEFHMNHDSVDEMLRSLGY
jgi:hypothetical protein